VSNPSHDTATPAAVTISYEEESVKMKRKHLLFFGMLIALLTLVFTGCGKQEQSLEGKNIVTFELQGGTLEYSTASTNTKINYAYEPGTFILDPVEFNNYKLYRAGYIFTGWYTSENCEPSTKWDFENNTIDQEKLTLYAGWKKAIIYSYTVYYMDGATPVALGKYEVNEGDKFEDWRKYANERDGYTPIAFYSDSTLETPWSADTAHPGGETDMDIAVYADYIECVWELVGNFTSLRSAINGNKNVYLTCDIDCAGSELFNRVTYSGVFNGNGYTVSNFTVAKFGTTRNPACSMFETLGKGAEIKNVSFTGVVYDFTGVSATANSYKVAALALSATEAKIFGVTVSGTVKTNCDESLLTKAGSAFYDEASDAEVEGLTINVTVENS
jgi:uncharacterized repeat protein (TIGR02543 family)